MIIRKLTEHDAESLWKLRLFALETDPISFGEAPEELRKINVEEYASRLRAGEAGNFVFGAFEGEAMIGMTGFYREAAVKRRHKGWIWGVFVAPSARGRGVGCALLAKVTETARALPRLRCLLLTVSTTQHAAIKVYQDAGFRSYGIEPGALMVGERLIDEHHMILEFDGSSR
jgi:ribosomal protein S18 acetylase RimI-like enzyme